MMHAQGPKRKHGDSLRRMQGHEQRLNRILTQVFEYAAKTGIRRENLDYNSVVCLFRGLILQKSITCMNLGNGTPVEDLLDLMLNGIGANSDYLVIYPVRSHPMKI